LDHPSYKLQNTNNNIKFMLTEYNNYQIRYLRHVDIDEQNAPFEKYVLTYKSTNFY